MLRSARPDQPRRGSPGPLLTVQTTRPEGGWHVYRRPPARRAARRGGRGALRRESHRGGRPRLGAPAANARPGGAGLQCSAPPWVRRTRPRSPSGRPTSSAGRGSARGRRPRRRRRPHGPQSAHCGPCRHGCRFCWLWALTGATRPAVRPCGPWGACTALRRLVLNRLGSSARWRFRASG